MKNWQKNSIRKSLENYQKTQDIEHLMDVIRVYEYGGVLWHVKRIISEFANGKND